MPVLFWHPGCLSAPSFWKLVSRWNVVTNFPKLALYSGRLIFYHYSCWRVGAQYRQKSVLVIIFLENAREFHKIITNTGATFWWKFCPSVLYWQFFMAPILPQNSDKLSELVTNFQKILINFPQTALKVSERTLLQGFWTISGLTAHAPSRGL